MAGNCKWAELPKEILEMFAKHLDSRIDVFRFRAVCTSWRSAASPSHLQHSLSPLFTRLCRAKDTNTFFPFTICCLQSQTKTETETEGEGSSSMVKVLELSSGELHIFNPLSGYSYGDQIRGKIVNLLNFRLIQLYKGYHLRFKVFYGDYKKSIFSVDCCKILGISNDGNIALKQLTCRNWNKFGSDETHYDDIIAYKGQFYVVDSWGIVSWINIESMNLVQYCPPIYGRGQLKNLIESDGCLYVVDSYVDLDRWRRPAWGDQDIDRVDRKSVRMDLKVYMFDEEWGTWVYVESLGDRIFVLGVELCFAFSARDFPDSQGNCIYFMEKPAGDQRDNLNYYDIWVFRLDDRSIRRVSSLPSHMKLFSPSMNWSFSTNSSP